MSVYVFDQAWQQERDRLGALESLFDRATRRYLTELGLRPGWRCLEVGCGAGGVALWLADQVGTGGQVTATDLDPRFLDGHGRPNLDVRVHDVVTDPLASGAYDLIHTRAVLTHLPDRERVLARLVDALRPGGVILVEDVDFGGSSAGVLGRCVSAPDPLPAIAQRMFLAVAAVFGAVGADPMLGTRLPGALAGAGLLDVGAELHAPIVPGGAETWTGGSLAQLRGRLLELGLAGAAEVDLALAMFDDPTVFHAPPLMVSAWGRRGSG